MAILELVSLTLFTDHIYNSCGKDKIYMKHVTSNQSHTYDIVFSSIVSVKDGAILSNMHSAFIYTFIHMCKFLFL